MRRIKLTIGYDGTDFCGWQIQHAQRTVQQEIERALKSMHGHDVRIHGSGRTDSGVHAAGQVAHFDTDIASIPADRFKNALNSRLPADVRINESVQMPDTFHARYDAICRHYRYVVRTYADRTPMNSRYCLAVPSLPNIQLLNGYCAHIVGTHDFSAFTAAGDASRSKIRDLQQASWHIEGSALVFTITGNAFLWKMVRSLVGTMLSLAQSCDDPQRMGTILAGGDRSQVGSTAAPQGLCLERIVYERT